jgi:aminopeptidase N
MQSLKNSMRWDEEVFGREYDLDIFNIVAVDDFNMGAMENKGLNVFNTKYVLANPQTATDNDYRDIEGVIAHEYFHNWTGNRVTCRDWFQLSLKEGLTVFRDQEFSADMMSRAIQRIGDVRVLRAHQFSEDASPMAHPVRPSSYQEINNFYTVTVYNKGAEVVRMYHTLLGAEGFRRGMDLYFERHDGQAVTTDDFRMAMQDANGFDLGQFQRWYEQAGTPWVRIRRDFDADSDTLRLEVTQQPGRTKEEPNQPFLIPMRLAFFDDSGAPLAMDASGTLEMVLQITDAQQLFEFSGLPCKPLVSVFRGFSAPVLIETDLSSSERLTLMAHDTDEFNQWDAAQQLAIQIMLEMIESGQLRESNELGELLDAFGSLLDNPGVDRFLLAEMLWLPAEKYLGELCQPIDIHAIHQVREFVRQRIAEAHEQRFLRIYHANSDSGEYRITPQAMGRRALKNSCLEYLTLTGKTEHFELAEQQFRAAANMTDQMAALRAVVHYNNDYKKRLFAEFYEQWSATPLVVDKWFSTLASSHADQALRDIIALEQHRAFNLKNPNRARSLIGSLQANAVVFHDVSGKGYEYLADKVLELDAINPQIAARMAHAFLNWKKLIPQLGEKMREQILRIQRNPGLSSDVAELMASCLADAG